jgi:hypothetical protein
MPEIQQPIVPMPMAPLGQAPMPAAPTPVVDPMVPQAVPTDPETPQEGEVVVREEILKRIDDSLKIEKDFREKGQKIQQIYRGELDAGGLPARGKSRFNSLNANTGILLPSLFSKPPTADIRSRGLDSDPYIDQACDIMQKVTNVILDDQQSFLAIKSAVKENLLPGRGIVRVRWDPIVEKTQAMGPMGQTLDVYEKLLDQILIEHVYWEDFTYEQTAQWRDTGWIAFRHLMTEKIFMGYFESVPIVQQWVAAGKKDDIFKWTDKTASRTRESARPMNENLQDVIKKAMVWEFWDKSTREIIWICQDMNGYVLSIDPDPMKLRNFFPCPMPLTAVTTTDQQLPRAEYEIYQDLAAEVDTLSERIAQIAKRIKVVGAYNGSQENLKEILQQSDGEMTAVNGLDIEFDLSKHVWVLPLSDLVAALQALYQARMEAKAAMYEVTGISDIVRGQTRASETLGAQRIKSQFAALRIEDRKRSVEQFSLGVIEIIAEIISEHFSPESIFFFTGIMAYPQSLEILKSDAMRVSRINVETDSTVVPDESAEQEAMSSMLQALGFVLQQVGPLVMQGIMPLPIAIEFVKMAIAPFKGSRKLNELLDQAMMMVMGQMLPKPGMMPQPMGAPPGPQPAQPGGQG